MTPSQKTALPHKVSRMNGANACPRVVQKFIGAYGKWRLPEKFGIRLIQRFIFVGSILLLCVGNNSEALADDRSGSPARAKTMRAWRSEERRVGKGCW